MVAVALVVAGCGGASAAPSVVRHDAPDRVVGGPQGAVGQFAVECEFDRFRADDPIVHPGAAGASHLHQFFGAVGVHADSTADELRAGATTCEQSADTASYWAPALVTASGDPIEPDRAVAYYRAGPDVESTSVQPYPPGFTMVAGDHVALEAQPTSVVAYGCGAGIGRHAQPVPCDGAPVTMIVTFPDCWNGVDVRSPGRPDAHVSYSRAGECPPEFPVPIPQLQLVIDHPLGLDVRNVRLASGNVFTLHADFWNTWDQAALEREIVQCIHRDLTCDVP